MDKSEFVAFIAKLGDISKVEAERYLNLIMESVVASLKAGKDIHLVGFGSFIKQKRKARKGRNPKTGAEMQIPAYNQPVFRAGKKLKESCN